MCEFSCSMFEQRSYFWWQTYKMDCSDRKTPRIRLLFIEILCMWATFSNWFHQKNRKTKGSKTKCRTVNISRSVCELNTFYLLFTWITSDKLYLFIYSVTSFRIHKMMWKQLNIWTKPLFQLIPIPNSKIPQLCFARNSDYQFFVYSFFYFN